VNESNAGEMGRKGTICHVCREALVDTGDIGSHTGMVIRESSRTNVVWGPVLTQ
jgi:hypothetical protein